MPWFKVDDSFHHHPKVMATSPAAIGLWVIVGTWCAGNLTDGFVPKQMLPRLLPDCFELASELVTNGLWVDGIHKGSEGYFFHDWNDFQPSAEAAKHRREVRREAGRKGGIASGKKRRASKTTSNSEANASAKSKQTRTPSPNPNQEGSSNEEPSSGRKRPATRLPDDWVPTDKHRAFAAENHLNLDGEVFKFRNHAHGKDRRQVNWNAAFSTWLGNARDWRTPRQARAAAAAGSNIEIWAEE